MSEELTSRAERLPALTSGSASGDAGLVLRAQRRDPNAWAQIYRENYDRLFRYTYARLGHRETAEDIAATVFLEALKGIGSYRHGDSPLLAWLYTIARNLVNQHHRRRFRRGPDPVGIGDLPAAALQAAEISLVAERLDLMDAVGRLPASQREVLLLHHFAGLTIPEVAGLLGKHERAVYSLQTRAIQGLRRRLDMGREGKSEKKANS